MFKFLDFLFVTKYLHNYNKCYFTISVKVKNYNFEAKLTQNLKRSLRGILTVKTVEIETPLMINICMSLCPCLVSEFPRL